MSMEKYSDALTGLQNRKALELTVDKLIKQEEVVSIALIDVDHFMEINNEFGSEKGDEVLRGLAEMMIGAAQNQAYRVSGDEFAIALPGSTLEQAFLSMEG